MNNKIFRLVLVFCCMIIVVCPLFNFGVNAYEPAYSVTFHSNGQPFSNFDINYFNGTDLAQGTQIGKYYPVDVVPSIFVDIIPHPTNSSNKIAILPGDMSVSVTTSLPEGRYYLFYLFTFEVDVDDRIGIIINDDSYSLNLDNSAISISADGATTVLTTVIPDTVDLVPLSSGVFTPLLTYVVIIPEADYGVPDSEGGLPADCPTLQTQINQFNGTYSDFEGMMLGSTNEVIYQGYRNKLQEMFRLGQDSVTLEQLLADYDGSFQQLITLLSENNLRLLDEYSDYIEEQRTLSYNDGYALGNEDGFNDGYNSGYNRGSSEVFGENLLGETFNMPLNALNNWVLFETSSGIEVTMGGLVTGLLALSILIILIKMFAGG